VVRALTARLADAIPPARQALPGSLLWGALMAASAAVSIRALGWANGGERIALLLYGCAAVPAFPLALFLARLATSGRKRGQAFAAAFAGLAGATIGITALVFGIEYRAYYSTWQGPAFSWLWANQFVFTVIAGVYQFLALGLRMYLPVGLPALFLAALWFAHARR
jgi:hypothetical protein